jgi:hypothetical protein
METVIEYLRRKLKEAGADSWPAIVEATGVAKTLPRKIAYGDRENPGVVTVQPLVDYFAAQDAKPARRRA